MPTDTKPRRKPRPWTPAEDVLLRRMVAAKRTCAEIAATLGRDAKAVANHSWVIGAVRFRCRPKARRERATAILTANPLTTTIQLARELGCSRHAAADERSRLGFARLTPSQWIAAANATRRANRANGLTGRESQILALLDAAGPLSAVEVIERTGIPAGYAYRLLPRLRKKGRAFAEGLPRKDRGECGLTWHSLGWWMRANAALVRFFVGKLIRRTGARFDDREDLESVVKIAVMRACKTFKPCGIKFATYAFRGAWFDAVNDVARERFRGMGVPNNVLEAREAQAPGVITFQEIGADFDGGDGAPYEPEDYRTDECDPCLRLWCSPDARQQRRALHWQYRIIMCLRYVEHWTLDEVAAFYGITKSRVQQYEAVAVEMLARARNRDRFAVQLATGKAC